MDERPVILVVDDEEPIVDAMNAWLTDAGYSVCVARKGSEAIEIARQTPPAVAVVDLLLDDMPGLAVMNGVRRFSPDTECVVVTGQAPEDSALAATELTAYGYMMKPCSADQLLLLISRAIEHGKTRKALRESGTVIDDLIERQPEAALILDDELTILALNRRAADVLGGEPKSLAGSRLTEHLPEESADEAEQHIKAAVDDDAEFNVGLADGPRRFKACPLKNERGEVARWTVFIDAA
jgi:ActR/RegA family two-component response regulator